MYELGVPQPAPSNFLLIHLANTRDYDDSSICEHLVSRFSGEVFKLKSSVVDHERLQRSSCTIVSIFSGGVEVPLSSHSYSVTLIMDAG